MKVHKQVNSQGKATQTFWLTLAKYGGLMGLVWLILCLPAQAAQELRIAIKKGVNAVQVGS